MNILSVDIGSYSLKCLVMTWEKKGLRLLSRYHHIFPHGLTQQASPSSLTSLEEHQIQALKNYLHDHPFDGPIILNYPAKKITYRFFHFPVTQKKKVEMMIPFQLDKNLLFSSQDVHTTHHLLIGKKQTFALTSITDLQHYDLFYKQLLTIPFFPEVHTTDVSSLMAFILHQGIEGPCCFLDLGHETTKAYIVQHRKIVAAHLSFFGGKTIDDVLEETYQISRDEAVSFKKQKAFFLTDQQMLLADAEQKDFALIMKQVMSPLIQEIKRWELGHRATFGKSFQTLFLYGGTSQIKNITAYFSQELGIVTQIFRPIQDEHRSDCYFDDDELGCFSQSFLMGEALALKAPLQNFFKGQYAQHQQADLPLHPLIFSLPRFYILLFILFFIVFMDSFSLHKKEKIYDQSLLSLYKGPILNLSRQEQRKAKENPDQILKKFQKQEQMIQEQILFFQKIDPLIGMKPFFDIHDFLSSSPDWELKSYASSIPAESSSPERHISLQFLIHQKTAIEFIKKSFQNLPYKNLKGHFDDSLQTYFLEYDL
jgi:cell division ATPase FtsA